MKFLSLLLPFLVSMPVMAAPNSEVVKTALESQSSCQRFVRYDDKYLYLGFGSGAIGVGPGQEVHMISLQSRDMRKLAISAGAVDITRIDNTLWILTSAGLEEWDLTRMSHAQSYPSYNLNGQAMQYEENPTGMAQYKNLLVISHGRLGYSIFDTTKKAIIFQTRLIPQQAPMESMATAVTISGNKAYFVLDNFTLPYLPTDPAPFRGFVVANLDNNEIESQLDGMDPGTDAALNDGKTLIVSFWGQPIWKYSLASIVGNKLPNPTARIFNFPGTNGHPTGIPSMDDKYYYTCFEKSGDNQPGGQSTLVPMAMDRAAFHLN